MSENEEMYDQIKVSLITTLEKNLFKNVYITLEEGSRKGDGYVGVLFQANISAEKDKVKHNFDCMVKCTPKNMAARKYVPITPMFRRELFFYKKIAPVYKRFHDEKYVPEDKIYMLPYCICINDLYGSEFILLENLKAKDYAMMKISKLDYEHALVALRYLGKFHALSFIYEERYPKEFATITAQLQDPMLECQSADFNNSGITTYGNAAYKKFLDVLEGQDYKNKVIEAVDGRYIPRLAYLWGSGNIKVITHGDYWTNNILFKCENGDPVTAVPLDFQIVRHASLANDIIYLMVMSADGELRRKCFWQLVEEYYFSLSEYTKIFGSDIKKFCTFDQLKAELRTQGVFGILASIFTCPFFTSEEILDLEKVYDNKIPDSFYTHNERFVKRANETVTDLVKLGLF